MFFGPNPILFEIFVPTPERIQSNQKIVRAILYSYIFNLVVMKPAQNHVQYFLFWWIKHGFSVNGRNQIERNLDKIGWILKNIK